MRTLNKNGQTLYYATFVRKTEIVDEYNNATGEYEIIYSAPAKALWNVGFVDSDAEVAMFGISAQSTLRIVAPKDGFPLNEASILWYGLTLNIKEDGTTDTAHNYKVVGIRPSLDTVLFYAQRVDVTQVVAQEPEPVGSEGA